MVDPRRVEVRVAGARGAEDINHDLVDATVADINALVGQGGLKLAVELGQLLLARFFGGDPAAFARGARKHRSFRALSRHPELDVSHSQLWNAVHVCIQVGDLPAELAWSLTLHHHKALLRVHDPARKVELATRALAEGWSYRRLRDEIARVCPRPRRGRPALPAWARGLRQVRRALDALESVEVHAADFEVIDPSDARELVASLDRDLDALARLKALVLKEIADREGSAW